MGLTSEEVRLEYKGYHITANIFFDEKIKTHLKLYIDDKIVDSAEPYDPLGIPRNITLLRKCLEINEEKHFIEVCVVGYFIQRLVVRINGVEYARSKG